MLYDGSNYGTAWGSGDSGMQGVYGRYAVHPLAPDGEEWDEARYAEIQVVFKEIGGTSAVFYEGYFDLVVTTSTNPAASNNGNADTTGVCPAAVGGDILKISTIEWGSVKKVSGIVEASIKKVSGIAANVIGWLLN